MSVLSVSDARSDPAKIGPLVFREPDGSDTVVKPGMPFGDTRFTRVTGEDDRRRKKTDMVAYKFATSHRNAQIPWFEHSERSDDRQLAVEARSHGIERKDIYSGPGDSINHAAVYELIREKKEELRKAGKLSTSLDAAKTLFAKPRKPPAQPRTPARRPSASG